MKGLFGGLVASVVAACRPSSRERDLAQDPTSGRVRYEYGAGPSQYAELTVPTGAGPHPVVVLIHGGFWRTGFGIDLMVPLVPSLVAAGFAVWNIEYRRVGGGSEGGGGWPGTFDDVATAIDLLADLPDDVRARLDLDRVATVGHSAGGHLAVWLASRPNLPVDSPWADPAVTPQLTIPQAGVLDLARCIADSVGGTACPDLLGNDDIDARIALGSPAALLPIDATVVAIHGDRDTIVPPNQSEGYVADAVAVGTDASVIIVGGADHFSNIDPADPAWLAVLGELTGRLA